MTSPAAVPTSVLCCERLNTRNHSTAIATEAFAQGTNVRDVVLRRQLMSEEDLNDALRHEVLTQPRAYAKKQ